MVANSMKYTKRGSTWSGHRDTVGGCTNGDAAERRSAYAKASAYAEAMADKTADKYEIGGEGVASDLPRKATRKCA